MTWINELRYDISKLKSSTEELKKFGITIGGIILSVSFFVLWKHSWNTMTVLIFSSVGIVLLLSGILFPDKLKLIYFYWMSFALLLGSIVSRCILSILFFIILTPITFLAKIISKKFFIQYRDTALKTYWIVRDRNKQINYERMS